MQAFRFLVVNAILCYDAVGGTVAASSPSSTGIVSSVAHNKPSRRDRSSSTPGNGPSAGRPSSIVRVGRSSAFPGGNSNLAAEKRGTPSVRALNGNENLWHTLFNRNPDRTDGLQRFGDTFVNVYTYTLNLLTLGMRNWLNDPDRDPDRYGRYLGYSEKTVDAIDRGMTELLGRQRTARRPNSQRINDLTDMYYYACDLENVLDRDSGDASSAVTRTFKRFIRGHLSLIVVDMTEDELVEALEWSLDRVKVKVKPEFGVTVPLMKNRIFVEPTDSAAVNRLADTVADDETGKTFRQLAAAHSKITSGTEVHRNHLKTVYHLVPIMFRYAFVYVHLLLKLNEFDLDENDMDTVRSFSTFTERFKSMFVDRYLEFRFIDDIELHLFLDSMIEFCNPKSTDLDEAAYTPNVLNFRWYKSKNQTDHYIEYANELTFRTVDALVTWFDFDISIEEWITSRSYTDEPQTKDDFMDLIRNNIGEGLEIMDEYSKYFISKV